MASIKGRSQSIDIKAHPLGHFFCGIKDILIPIGVFCIDNSYIFVG